MLKKHLFSPLLLILAHPLLHAQPISLRPDVTVQFVTHVHEKAVRIAKDPVSGNFFYHTATGNIYEIKNINSNPTETLLYTASTHGIDFLQGMVFSDSTLFIIGNKLVDSTGNIGLIKKAVLQPSGQRTWFTVAVTDTYPQSWTWYDHGFSGITVSPDKNHLFFSSGSRTDHGEEQNNYGKYPGMREVPLTSAIFRIPANSVNLQLPNDANLLAPYLYADGTRNSFDMAFDAAGNLFATENSGDRDDPDELNWIRQGKHYGFPWILGGNDNPQQFPGYDPHTDKLLNCKCNCYLKNYYYDDPAFPPKPSFALCPSVKNTGPDADKFRDATGHVNDGSQSGTNLNSFTPHRCPLGISIDSKKLVGADLNGDAFVVSFTRGGDSTGLDKNGYPGTVCDPGQDLLHITLTPDGPDNYQMQAVTIVNNFDYPVDTYLDSNLLYVIEYSYSGDGRLFRVTLPAAPQSINEAADNISFSILPNPTAGIVQCTTDKYRDHTNLSVYSVVGNCILSKVPVNGKEATIDLTNHPPGIYFVQVNNGNKNVTRKIIKY